MSGVANMTARPADGAGDAAAADRAAGAVDADAADGSGAADSPAGRFPLAAALSQILVAFTIEFDNEFEHQMPHRTTRHGSTGPGAGVRRPPWLVSMAMWEHCMRFIPEEGIPAAELARRAQLTGHSMQTVLRRMGKWWGYLVVQPDPADTRAKPPQAAWLVRPTSAGRRAQEIWAPLTGMIEERWRDRFGRAEIEQFCAALQGIVVQLDVRLPDYLPVGELAGGEPPPMLAPAPRSASALEDAESAADRTLSALLSKVLMVFARDFERDSDLSLGIYTSGRAHRLEISANVLRVLDEQGVRVQDVPRRTGVAKMTIDNWLGALEEHRYLVVGPDPAGSRFRVARLTPRGRQALDTYRQWVDGVEQQWAGRFGEPSVQTLRAALERLGLAGEPAAAALIRRGLEPYPDGWRAQVRTPPTLPHYPVISPRGGFPDGS
jgi:DNA-binding MarR family transcriptional regulator